MLVKTVMKTPVVTIAEDQSVSRARALLLREGMADLIVVRQGKPVGVLGDRELRLAPVSGGGRSDWQTLWDNLPVESVMTQSTLTVSAQSHVRDAIRVLCEGRVDSLPVVQDGEIVGIVTIAELLGLLSNLLE
jgi:acetoin utilization protein AcuB